MSSRPYEALVIVKVGGSEAEAAQAIKHVEEPIQKLGGHIERSTSWGRRRLAYRIARQTEGTYHLIEFLIEPQKLDELKRLLRLNETIVRFLVLNRSEHQPPTSVFTTAQPSATAAAASGSRQEV